MIHVEHLSKSFGPVRAVQDLSFDVRLGEILGFAGPNGAGKTTTLRILAGYFPPSSGCVRLNGRDLYRSPKIIRRQIGYLPENSPLYSDMVTEDFLNWAAHMKGVPRAERKKAVAEVAAQCGIGSVGKRLIGVLSKGYRQRIGLAQALIGNPACLILDEPTSGLDPKQIIEIRSLIQSLGKKRTVILSTHILPEISMMATRVFIIYQGRLIANGTPEELGGRIRHTRELLITIRGSREVSESCFRHVKGIMAMKLEKSTDNQHSYRLIYRDQQDIRPVLSRQILDAGLELMSLQEAPVSLEDIFLKLVVREAGVNGAE